MALTEGNNDKQQNPYLALRAAKIARNEDRLKELGLWTKPKQRRTREKKQSARKPAPSRESQNSQTQILVNVPQRRSRRLASQPASSPEEGASDGVVAPPIKRQRKVASKTKTSYAPAADSVRRIEISVSDTVKRFLGRTMEHTGKAYVIQATLDGTTASFNKYSGVQEWGNDTIYLWINLGKKDDEIVNEFYENGRQITWFGGSRMHDESPVVQKLLRVSKSTVTSSRGVVLWCRHFNAEKKTYHPYTCLGRLAYVSHDPGSRPLRFVWKLLDYEQLVENADLSIRERFHELVNC